MTLKRYLLAVCVALALLVVGSVGGAVAGDDESNPPSASVSQVAAIEPEAKDALGVLGQSRGPGDALPEDYAARMDERSSFGMNPALSRRAIGNMTNSVYLIPARDHVCAALTDGQGVTVACPPTDDIASGKVGAATVAFGTGGIGVYGVVPDGVDSVSVQTIGTSSVDIATENNAYYTVIPAGTPVQTMSYVGPSGPVEFPIYDPARAFGEE